MGDITSIQAFKKKYAYEQKQVQRAKAQEEYTNAVFVMESAFSIAETENLIQRLKKSINSLREQKREALKRGEKLDHHKVVLLENQEIAYEAFQKLLMVLKRKETKAIEK